MPLSIQWKGRKKVMTKCQIDTGASCNVISEKDLKSVQNDQIKMHRGNPYVTLYNDETVMCLGEVNLTCTHNGQRFKDRFKVMKTSQMPILSCDLSLRMGLISINDPKVNEQVNNLISGSSDDILNEFKDVFEGLGKLPGKYKLEVDEKVTPVKMPIRRVAVPIRNELKEKLTDMEKRGIIEKVSKPTEWLSSLVIVKKPGKLRICLDPRPLNKAIKRPHYMLPTIDDILPKLTKARVFTVLDAKEAFWQVQLTEESSYLTTFGTQFGRYRYKRMPYGVCSATDELQRRSHEIVEDLDGVDVIADDFVIYGSGDTDEEALAVHETRLKAFLERAREMNLKLNRKKAQLRVTSIKYMGHIISKDGLRPDPAKVEAIQKNAKTRLQEGNTEFPRMYYLPS